MFWLGALRGSHSLFPAQLKLERCEDLTDLGLCHQSMCCFSGESRVAIAVSWDLLRFVDGFGGTRSRTVAFSTGPRFTGGDSSAVAEKLSGGVAWLVAAAHAMVAVKEDGSLVTWGDPAYGGNTSAVAHLLREGVVKVCTNSRAFAAVKEDGSVGGSGSGWSHCPGPCHVCDRFTAHRMSPRLSVWANLRL